MLEKPDFEEYMEGFFAANKRESGWNDFAFSMDHLKEIHTQLFGTPFDQNDKEFFYDVINPTTEKSVINTVSRFEDAGFRDQYILSEIERFWNDGNSIFIIYGASHAVMQEPVVRDLVNG